jgi:serine/threonine-protein kinase
MSLVRIAIDPRPADDASVTGIIATKGRLYHAAVAPIGAGPTGVVQGYLINARLIDQKFADHVAETTRTSVAFLPAREGADVEVTRSTNAPNAERFRAMAEIGQVASSGQVSPPHNATIDGGEYLLTAEPLRSADEIAAVAVFVRSLDAELAPFREIERTLVLAGVVALVFAFLLSGLVASRVTRPIVHLAEVAQAVADGDLSVRPVVETHDEVGILATSFAKMVSALRDKAELEELYEQMAERSQEVAADPLSPAEAREGTVMVTDLRGVTSSADPGQTVSLLDETVKMQESEIRRQDGAVISVTGHQVLAVFEGDRGVVHAVRAARAIGENLATTGEAGTLSLAVGIATGDFVSGGIRTAERSTNTLSGDTPLLATLFAWEAPAGSMFLSKASAQQAGGELLSAARHEEISLRWLPMPIGVAHVPLVGVTTGMIPMVTQPGTSEATVKLDGTESFGAGAMRDLETGTVFASRYRIESILGRGGMGVVYKATDLQLDEAVAIKTLPQRAMSSSPEEVERFKREIRVARKITHRNVLRTFDYGEADGWYFISMEYVRGYTLADLLLQTSQMTTRSALGVVRQISRGLEAAHDEGVIHRDIKPQNVLIDHKGEVKLMDFGIARAQEAEAMTQQGVIVGTPHYMSPEQVQGKALDPRSDVYSMGVMMYEILCGVRPFNSSSLTAVLTAHVTEEPLPPIRRRQEIGPEINAIVVRCLAKDPAERYRDAGALLEALNKIQVENA